MADWISVSAQMVARVRYDAALQHLPVEFTGGSSGYYTGVPAQVFEAFLAAPSRGRFVIDRLKPNYPWVPLGGGVRTPRLPTADREWYRYRCGVCGAERTLPLGAAMPKHPRKGDASTYKLDCPGSETPGIILGPAPPPRRRRP